jgi:hypothetical protein
VSTETVKCGYYAVDADGNERSAEWTEERPAGEMDRETAAMHYATEPPFANELAAYFEMRLGLTKEEHEALLLAAPSSWHEYPTYKRHFELLRPVFALALRLQLIPESFYRKYCHR